MKKLFGILLALAVAMAIALPVLAADEASDLKIVDTNIDAAALRTYEVQEEIYDEETKEFIGMGPKWTYYDWTKFTYVDVEIDGEKITTTVDEIGMIYSSRHGWNYSGGIMDGQSAENQWEVGRTYEVYYYIFDMEATEGDGIVWDVTLNVTLKSTEAKLQLSDITINELMGKVYEKEDGSTFLYYDPLWHGLVDAAIDGKEYKKVTMEMLSQELQEEYGHLSYAYNYIYEGDQYPDNQEEKPWQVGDTFKMDLTVFGEKECLFSGEITITLCENDIERITAEPKTVYAHARGGAIKLTSHYKDGTSGPCRLEEWYLTEEIPEEPGTYTMTILVANTFEVPFEVTVLPSPTSGKLGENVNWAYDKTTETLTISGTGDTYYADVNMSNYTEEFNEWANEWNDLMRYYLPKNVVVEEGVTGLMPGFMMQAFAVENFTLPNSLKKLPMYVLGYNGPSSIIEIGLGFETTGVTTFVLPQNITNWDELAFGYTWGVKDIYIPAGVTSINIENLIYNAYFRMMNGSEDYATTIHFAGTEAQWNAITLHVPDTDYGMGMGLEDAQMLMKYLTIVFDDPAASYIKVENGSAVVTDNNVKAEEGKDIVIDVSSAVPDAETENTKVESVVIGSAIVDKIVEAETNVEIKLPEATVSFDKTAMGSIGQQAADKDVTIVATEVKTEELNDKQQTALDKKAVYTVLNLEAKAGDEKITEFGGGKVTISVAFELPEGTIGTDFVVAYVADDGTITLMPTQYADGVLSFETTHFSNYVVLAVSDNPKTGNTSMSVIVALLVLSGAACVTLCANKRRLF